MKIGVVYDPRPQTWPKFQWVHEGLLNLGHAVTHLKSIDELMAFDGDAQNDLVLFEHRDPGLGRKQIVQAGAQHKLKWVQWWFDLCILQKHEDLLGLYGQLMQTMDFVIVKERMEIEAYQARGINAVYGDQGCPSNMRQIQYHESPEFDVVLFGTRMEEYNQRFADVRALIDAGFRVAWAGGGGGVPEGCVDLPWCHPMELPDLLSRGAVTLAVDLESTIPGYWSDRVWLATGAGACVLRRHDLDRPSVPHISYNHTEWLIMSVRRLVQNHKGRKRIGESARLAVMDEHTIECACERVFNAIGINESVHAGSSSLQCV